MESKGEDTPTDQEAAAAGVEQEQQRAEGRASPTVAEKPADAPVAVGEARTGEVKAQPDAGDEAKKHIDNMKAMAKQEREQRRAEAARAEAAEQRAAALENQMRQLMARVQAGQQQAPDPEVDVVAALKHTQAQLNAERQRQAQEAQARAEHDRQTEIAKSIRTKVEDYETEFKAENPDYDAALDHVLDTKEAEFELAGFPKDVAKRQAAQWAMNAAAAMLQTGRNPAEQAYALAKRMGYQPKAAAQAAPSDAQALAAQQNVQRLATIKDGQNATSKMSGGGSQSGFDGSLKSIAGLEGAAFDSAAEKFLRQMTRN